MRIKTLSRVLAGVLICTGLGIGAVSLVTVDKVGRASAAWESFDKGAATKSVILSDLRGALGYGGMIHRFKNFVLRKDRMEIVNIQEKLRRLTIELVRYESLGVTETEKIALERIDNVVMKYSGLVAVVEDLAAKGVASSEIDAAVMVDDRSALEAIKDLQSELLAARKASGKQVYDSVSDVSNLVTLSTIGINFVFLAVIVGFISFSQKRLTGPLAKLGRAMEALADGDYTIVVPFKGRTDEIGAMASTVEVFRNDAIERQKTKAELQEKEQRIRSLIDTMTDGLITIDRQGIIRSVNPAAERHFGYTAEELLGQSVNMLMPEDLSQKHDGYLSDYRHTGFRKIIGMEREVTGRRKDGSFIPLELSVTELSASGQQMFTGLMRDITRRKRAEHALRENQQRLNSIMNSVVDAVITFDADGLVRSFNHAAEQIFGYSMIEVLDKSVGILTPEPNAGDHDNGFLNVCKRKAETSPGLRPEITGQRKDGTTFPLEVSISRMDLPGQSMFVGICRDITRRKIAQEDRAELERELGQAQKLESLGTLAGGIAHEINTPLQFISDNARFLKTAFSDLTAIVQEHMALLDAAIASGVLTDTVARASAAAEARDTSYLLEEVPGAIEHSLEGLEQIAEIVQAIKEFSYPNTKEKSLIDINHAITTTITVSRNQWKHAAELVTDFDAALPLVPCLPGELTQVVLNLIINAAHAIENIAGDSKGRITISTRRVGDWAEIRVSDTGCGIPKENLDKVFEPFFTTKEPGKGTGQGLAISHTIIRKKHNGTLTLDSEVGNGTVFIIRLPLVDHDQSEAAA